MPSRWLASSFTSGSARMRTTRMSFGTVFEWSVMTMLGAGHIGGYKTFCADQLPFSMEGALAMEGAYD